MTNGDIKLAILQRRPRSQPAHFKFLIETDRIMKIIR